MRKKQNEVFHDIRKTRQTRKTFTTIKDSKGEMIKKAKSRKKLTET